MRIAILADLFKPISRHATGGTEVFCAVLAEGLAKRGHTVTVFATEASSLESTVHLQIVAKKTYAELVEEHPSMTVNEKASLYASLAVRSLVLLSQQQSSFDVVHDCLLHPMAAAISDRISLPMVTTIHMPPHGLYEEIPGYVGNPNNTYVGVADWQMRASPFIHDRVYNGIDIHAYPFYEAGGEPMIWIGRVGHDAPKGLREALIAANATSHQLRFAPGITDEAYYAEEIIPLLGSTGVSVGIMNAQKEKTDFYGTAKCAVFPIQWEEPFGLVFIEAMASGTPVITFARGATPEIIVDGVNGLLVNPSDTDIRGNFKIKQTGQAGIEEAIRYIYALSSDEYRQMRQNARKRVEELFTVDRMCEGYEKIYQRVSV